MVEGYLQAQREGEQYASPYVFPFESQHHARQYRSHHRDSPRLGDMSRLHYYNIVAAESESDGTDKADPRVDAQSHKADVKSQKVKEKYCYVAFPAEVAHDKQVFQFGEHRMLRFHRNLVAGHAAEHTGGPVRVFACAIAVLVLFVAHGLGTQGIALIHHFAFQSRTEIHHRHHKADNNDTHVGEDFLAVYLHNKCFDLL